MRPRNRARPLPDAQGEALLRELLADIEEEERLSAALGVDLSPPAPRREHAPKTYGPLSAWLQRSDEAHRHREIAYRAERGRLKP